MMMTDIQISMERTSGGVTTQYDISDHVNGGVFNTFEKTILREMVLTTFDISVFYTVQVPPKKGDRVSIANRLYPDIKYYKYIVQKVIFDSVNKNYTVSLGSALIQLQDIKLKFSLILPYLEAATSLQFSTDDNMGSGYQSVQWTYLIKAIFEICGYKLYIPSYLDSLHVCNFNTVTKKINDGGADVQLDHIAVDPFMLFSINQEFAEKKNMFNETDPVIEKLRITMWDYVRASCQILGLFLMDYVFNDGTCGYKLIYSGDTRDHDYNDDQFAYRIDSVEKEGTGVHIKSLGAGRSFYYSNSPHALHYTYEYETPDSEDNIEIETLNSFGFILWAPYDYGQWLRPCYTLPEVEGWADAAIYNLSHAVQPGQTYSRITDYILRDHVIEDISISINDSAQYGAELQQIDFENAQLILRQRRFE